MRKREINNQGFYDSEGRKKESNVFCESCGQQIENKPNNQENSISFIDKAKKIFFIFKENQGWKKIFFNSKRDLRNGELDNESFYNSENYIRSISTPIIASTQGSNQDFTHKIYRVDPSLNTSNTRSLSNENLHQEARLHYQRPPAQPIYGNNVLSNVNQQPIIFVPVQNYQSQQYYYQQYYYQRYYYQRYYERSIADLTKNN